jgi:hypothetical protein
VAAIESKRPQEIEGKVEILDPSYFLLKIAAKASSLVRNCRTLPSI